MSAEQQKATPELARLDRLERAEILRRLMEIHEAVQRIMDVVMPEDAPMACPHPADRIVDESTMDDDGQSFRCLNCNAVSKIPFPTLTED